MAFVTITEIRGFRSKCIFKKMSTLEQPLSDGHATVAVSSVSERKRKRLLLIEDQGVHRLVLLQKLRSAGFDVDVASNGRLALEKLRSVHPDAIFMDLVLSYVKGVDVIKAARRDPGFASRPIYVCTSAANMNAWSRRGTKAGATKVFDRASARIDTIVAEVAADLIGPDAGPAPTDNGEFEGHQDIATKLETDEAELRILQPPGQALNNDLPAGNSPIQPVSFMQRMVKALGLGKTEDAGSQRGATANLASIPAAKDPTSSGAFNDAAQNQLSDGTLQNRSSEGGVSQPGGVITPVSSHRVAVLTLDQAAKILSVNETCATMFGWEGPELIGQNLNVLLKEGQSQVVQQHLRQARQQQPAGDHSQITCPPHLVVRRKDGTEFLASLTTLTWISDTTLMRRSDASQFCWTAFFREVIGGAASQGQAKTVLEQVNQVPAGPSAVLTEEPLEFHEPHAASQRDNEYLQKQLHDLSAEAAQYRGELTKREKEREDLSGRIFANEIELNRTRAELQRESSERKELEQKLQDLTATKAELEMQLAVHSQSEEDLLNRSRQFREQLDEAKALAGRAETACQQEVARANRFEEDLADLRRQYDEVSGKLTSEQQAATESQQQTGVLESRMRESAAEVERVKTELEKQITERGRLEAEWCEKLHSAEALTKKLEAAWREEADRSKSLEERLQNLCNNLKREQIERSKRFDSEVAGLRQARDELQGKLTAEQQATTESTRRAEELENRLRDSAAEVERVKAELERQTTEQQRLESEWREKLNTAEALTNKLEAAWVEAEERNRRFEEELAGLRQVRDELQSKLIAEHEAAAESKRRNDQLASRVIENAVELERVRVELEKAGRNEQFEERLNSLQQVRDELSSKLTLEQQSATESRQRSEELANRLRENTAELERVKSDADKHAEEQARLESELQAQLKVAQAAAEQAEAALKEKVAQCSQFENELTSLRQVRDELNGKLTHEQQAAAESRRRNEELESRLRDNAAELEHLKADTAKHATEQAHLESELRAQLHAAKAAAEQAEAALKQEAARNRSFEERVQIFGHTLKQEQTETAERSAKDLASLQQVRDELSRKLTVEQQAAADSRQRSEELESRLRQTAAELERLQAQLARHVEDRQCLESQAQEQLNAAKTAAEKAETAWRDETERSKRFEEELAGIRKERDELHGKFLAEQQAASASKQRSEDLENRLRENDSRLEHIKSDLDKHAEDQARLQSELHAQQNAAKAAAEQAQAALNEKTAQCNQFENELASLRQLRDELNGKLTLEQQAAAEFRGRNQELESRLHDHAAELERLMANTERGANELTRLESELHAQQNAAKAAAEQAQAALNEKLAQCSQFENELTSLRQVRDELHGQLAREQQAAADSRRRSEELESRLRDNAAELERLQADADNHAAQQAHLEFELQAQRNAAKAAAEQAEAALNEKIAQCSHFENELASLRQVRDELHGKLAAEQQAAAEFRLRNEELEGRLRDNAAELERVKAELEKQAAEQARLESSWREQLSTAQTAATRAQEALKEGARQQRQLERNVANLRNERLQFCDKFRAEREAGAKSKRRIKELEKRLRASAADLQQAKVELEKQAAERGRLESESLRLLEAAQATAQQELENLRRERETLTNKLTAEQQAAADSKRRSEEFEDRLSHSAAELERVKAELNQHAQERARLEFEYRSFNDTKEALATELRALRENEAAHKAEITELEGRLREGIASLARLTSDLETERGERCRIEQRAASLAAESQELHEELKQHLGSEQAAQQRVAELLQQLREHEDAVTRLNADLQREMVERQSAEEQLRVSGDISAQLRNHLSLLDEAKQTFAIREGELESRLQSSLNALRESESTREKGMNACRRLEEALETAQREYQRRDENNAIELSKLKSLVQVEQVERKRLEADAIQSRYSSLDSARVGRAMVNNFRSRMRERVDNLIQSSRHLLAVKSDEEQKKLIESLLENALFIQTSLQENGTLHAESDPAISESQIPSGDPGSRGLASDQQKPAA